MPRTHMKGKFEPVIDGNSWTTRFQNYPLAGSSPVCMNPLLDTCIVFFKFINLFLTVLGFHCCAWAFSSCGEQELLSSRSARTSHLGGVSCCGSRLWSTGAQQLWCIDLVVPWHVESSWTSDQTRVPCIDRWILKLDHQWSPLHNILVTLTSEYEEK